MRIIYFGKGKRGKICLSKIIENGHNVVAFISENIDDICHAYAEKTELNIIKVKSINSPDVENKLKSLKADIFILSGFSQILKKNIFQIPKIATINLHGGSLPFYRGAAPINWQIINGEKIGGCCIIEVDEGIDTGPILIQNKYDINFDDTHYSVLNKTLRIFPNILLKVLNDFDNFFQHKTSQSITEGNYFKRRFPEDSKIRWSTMTELEVYNLIRGMYGPYQWAFSYLNDRKIEFKPCDFISENSLGQPGEISKITSDGVFINCFNNALLIKEVKVNKHIYSAKNFFKMNQKLI